MKKKEDMVGIPKGTKLTDNPKDKRFELRLNNEQAEKLAECSKKLETSKTNVIIKGIDKVYEELK